MKFFSLLLILLAASFSAIAQVEFESNNYFPTDSEFSELHGIHSETDFSDPGRLSEIAHGQLISDVGFRAYAQRTYSAGDAGSLSVEIVSLIDYRAAYSLLSLLRTSEMLAGPPGDAYATAPDSVLFCKRRNWVRIVGHDIPGTLVQRVAASVNSRMGNSEGKLPSLISYLPESGLQASSLEYFPGAKAFADYHPSSLLGVNPDRYEMEIARASYDSDNGSATLSLLKFPTTEMAEAYFSDFSSTALRSGRQGVFFRMSGPLVSVLNGSLNTADAWNILDSIHYSYSVQWIRDNRTQYKIVWGVPVPILNTTVLSFFFALILCVLSILVGGIIAGFRLLLRRFVPNNPLDDPERTEITRLKLP
jgi:hypothetical protein